jgi:dihydrodipicolinate reductase
LADVKSEHSERSVRDQDTLELRHDVQRRSGFAPGAMRGEEWLAGKSGAWEFRKIFDQH